MANFQDETLLNQLHIQLDPYCRLPDTFALLAVLSASVFTHNQNVSTILSVPMSLTRDCVPGSSLISVLQAMKTGLEPAQTTLG